MRLTYSKKNIIILLSFVVILSTISFSLLNKDKHIFGSVHDIFGNPIDSVHVHIKNSGFKALTSEKGQYKIDYAPGNFSIIYSKEGYIPESLELSLVTKQKFPAAGVELWPIAKQGISYVNHQTNNIEVLKDTYPVIKKERSVQKSASNSEIIKQHIFLTSEAGNFNLSEGLSRFISNSTVELQLFKIDPEFNLFLAYETKPSGSISRYAYNGKVEETSTKVGPDQLSLKTVNLEPGLYAWLQCDKTVDNFGEEYSKPMGIFYPFTVGQDWKNHTIVLNNEQPASNFEKPKNSQKIAPASEDLNNAQSGQSFSEVVGLETNSPEVVQENRVARKQSDNNQDTPANTTQGDSSLIKDTGSMMQGFGSAFNEVGEKRGGLIGKGFGLAGRVYTSVGKKLEGSENSKSVGSAYKESISAAQGTINEEANSSGSARERSHSETNNRPHKNIILYEKGKTLTKSYCITLLNDLDYDQVREAAKYIFFSDLIYDEDILKVIEKKLLDEHKKDNIALVVDTLSWFCKILGNSGSKKYSVTLDKIAHNGNSWKLRSYAKHNRDKLSPKPSSFDDSDFENHM